MRRKLIIQRPSCPFSRSHRPFCFRIRIHRLRLVVAVLERVLATDCHHSLNSQKGSYSRKSGCHNHLKLLLLSLSKHRTMVAAQNRSFLKKKSTAVWPLLSLSSPLASFGLLYLSLKISFTVCLRAFLVSGLPSLSSVTICLSS